MPQSLDELARGRIKAWIGSTGITQAELGTRIGRNQAWMSRYLSGDIDADLTTLTKMAQVFSHTLFALLDVPSEPEEVRLLEGYRALRHEAREIILKTIAEWGRARKSGRTRGRTAG